MGERDEMNSQNRSLKEAVESQKEDKTRELADKEREKVQAIDRLRDEMLTKIKDMRSNLLSLKKEQLDTTTRLAVLQNHQLTSELEFQSKQSEKLIFENEHLLKKVSNLQKDLEVHREIEEELAKRSHYSRGIIKKLTTKIAELEEELKDHQARSTEPPESAGKASDDHKREEIIKALDRNLESSEKKYIKLQSESDLAKQELKQLRSKVEQQERKTTSLLEVLLRAYSQFEEGELRGS
jgi:chromosome segregation ATPase